MIICMFMGHYHHHALQLLTPQQIMDAKPVALVFAN